MHGSCPCCPGNHIFCLEMFEDNCFRDMVL